MPVLAEASCGPGLRRSLSPPGFGSASSVCIAPHVPFSSASHTAKHILHTSLSSIPYHRDTFSAISPILWPSKTHSSRRAAAA